MADNKSDSSSDYVPSGDESENEAASTEDEVNGTEDEVADTESLKDFNYTDLAALLQSSNNANFNLSTEEDGLITGSCVNTVRYKKSKAGIEKRFFDTIDQFGGIEMKPLLEIVEVKKIHERRFYVVLRGRRNEHKRIILSKCLLLCALKWRNQSKKDFGKQLQPETWATMLRTLFSIFKAKGILFKHTRDFNNDGEFHAVLKKQWENAIEDDDTFGTGIGTSEPDLEADRKIREKYDEGLFDPFTTSDGPAAYQQRLWYTVFILGRYWLLRGRKEVAFLNWSQVKFCTATENNEPVEYIEVVHHFDKGNKLSITNTTARSKNGVPPRLYPNHNDPLCPVKYMKFFRSLCCPEQERVLCRLYNTKQMKKWRRENKPYLYNPNLIIGENSIDGINKEFAEFIGLQNWERCTNHSNRKLGISTAVSNAPTGIQHVVAKASRHKDVNTQKRYFKESADTMQAYNRAITGKHVPSPTKSPTKTNKKPNKQSTPESLKKPKSLYKTGELITIEKTTTSDGTITHYDESSSYAPEASTTTSSMPHQVMIPCKEGIRQQHGMVKTEGDNYHDEFSMNNSLAGKGTNNNHTYPLVTPNDTYRPIITQNHLSHIQRNIFLPQDMVRDDTIQALQQQMNRLQNQLEEAERKKKEDELLEWKEKYHEAKQEARFAKLENREKNNYMCVIQ